MVTGSRNSQDITTVIEDALQEQASSSSDSIDEMIHFSSKSKKESFEPKYGARDTGNFGALIKYESTLKESSRSKPSMSKF
jgi:hypothetical protein